MIKLLKKKQQVKVSSSAKTKARQKEMCKKYPDEYMDCIKKKVLQLNESTKLIFSVRRKDDDLGLPWVDIRIYVSSPEYTGFTKKGISFPLERLEEFREIVEGIDSECDEKGVY